MWLKLKILLGYVILLLLLVLTIHIFRKEQTRRNSLRQDEHELACIRHLAGETYAGLLGLATYGETASVWDESDLGLYHTKKDSVCNMLQTLKRYVKSPEQQSRIDSLCLLLERKELLLDTVMDTFGRLRKTGEIDREQQDSGNRVPYPAGGCPSCREKEGGGNSEEGFLVIHQAREEKIGLSAAEGTAGTPATVHW